MTPQLKGLNQLNLEGVLEAYKGDEAQVAFMEGLTSPFISWNSLTRQQKNWWRRKLSLERKGKMDLLKRMKPYPIR